MTFAQIFVKQGGTGNGSSWDQATGTIPTGTLPANTKIYIAAGNYSISGTTTLQENGILIQGGFPTNATGTSLSGYNPLNNVTLLTKSGGGIFYDEGSTSSSDVTNQIEVKGMQFTGASGNGALFQLSVGHGNYKFTDVTAYNMTVTNGVIYLTSFTNGSVTIENSNFYGNTATADGGVVYHTTDYNNAKLIIRGSSFSNNKAVHGGALYITSINNSADAVLIENSNFCSNSSVLYGGAIYQTSSRITIRGSIFSSNTCPQGYYGGAIFSTTSQLTISDSQFYKNLGGAGGAIYHTTAYDSNPNTLTGGVFLGNEATNASWNTTGTNGGGALCLNANANNWTISSSIFVGNKVPTAGWGGAISHYDLETKIDKCTFFNNTKGGVANIKGSDIMNYDNAGGFYSITDSKMQLASAGLYRNQTDPPYPSDASSYGFSGTGNTFSNTDNGGVIDPDITCPITINFVEPLLTLHDFNVTYINIPVDGNVSTNDVYPSGTTYGTPVPDANNPTGGTITIDMNPDGNYTFTSTIPGVFVYEVPVCIPGGGTPCPTETLTITVLENGSINPPVANPDYASGMGSTTGPASPITSLVKINDGPGNPGGTLGNPTLTSGTPPATVGTITESGENIIFTPAQGFFGEYEATYSICETPGDLCAETTVTFYVKQPDAENTTIAADDYVSTQSNIPVSGNVKTNDTDPEGDNQNVTPQTTNIAGKGSVTITADGNFTFTPEAGFVGPVEFIYETCDDGTATACAMATLHVLVSDVPDLTPILTVTPTNITGTDDIELVVDVFNIPTANASTNGSPIKVYITKDSKISLTFDPNESTVGGKTVQNGDWTFDETSNASFYILTTTSVITGFESLSFGLTGTLNPGALSGTLTISSTILGESGGEVNDANNEDAESVVFYKN